MKNILSASASLITSAFLLAGCGTASRNPDTSTADSVQVSFRKHTLTRDFLSEGAAAADINKDGRVDILSGPYWYEAPGWERHEIFPAKVFDPATGYSDSFLNFTMDINNDGWIDFIVIDYPGKVAHWFENPRNENIHWQKRALHETVLVGNESPALVDVDGDGRLDLLCADSGEKQMVWLQAPGDNPAGPWRKNVISEKGAPGTDKFSHGLGLGDINGDGRNDVVIKQGWWEAPEDRTQSVWKFHAADLGEDCSQMHVFDINGDGLNDVFTASAHRYGIWWYEQGKGAGDESSWTKHEISTAFSQTHGSSRADMNADGHADIVIGKRFWAHNNTDNDPGGQDPAVLYWFEFTPGKPPFFRPHEIDQDSGVGLHVVTQDVTLDGVPDIVIGNKKGVFLFEQVADND